MFFEFFFESGASQSDEGPLPFSLQGDFFFKSLILAFEVIVPLVHTLLFAQIFFFLPIVTGSII